MQLLRGVQARHSLLAGCCVRHMRHYSQQEAKSLNQHLLATRCADNSSNNDRKTDLLQYGIGKLVVSVRDSCQLCWRLIRASQTLFRWHRVPTLVESAS
jgi:hypothetical protein